MQLVAYPAAEARQPCQKITRLGYQPLPLLSWMGLQVL